MAIVGSYSAKKLASWVSADFSLHAGVRVEAGDKKGLEHLARYAGRPARQNMHASRVEPTGEDSMRPGSNVHAFDGGYRVELAGHYQYGMRMRVVGSGRHDANTRGLVLWA